MGKNKVQNWESSFVTKYYENDSKMKMQHLLIL